MSPPPINLNSTLGAVFIGNVVGGILYGITTMQTFIYFKGNSRDRPSFRLLVGFLWILDSVHTAFMTHGVYHYLVTNFSNFSALARPPWTILSLVIITCISDLIVRCVFARRIWLLSGHKNLLLFAILGTSVFVFGTGIAFAVRGFIGVTFLKLIRESWLLYTALGSGVVADILVVTSLCVLLDHSRTGFKSTNSLVNTLMLYSINTGLLTSVCAMACFVTFAIWPHGFVFIGIYFVLGKLFVNTLLAVLNTREGLREKNSGVTTIPKSPSAIDPFMPSIPGSYDIIESPQNLKLTKFSIRRHSRT